MASTTTDMSVSAANRTFAIPELLDRILTYLLCNILPVEPQDDPRTVRVHGNAYILEHLLRLTEVSRVWHQNITRSSLLQQALFHRPAPPDMRSWTLPLSRLEGSYSIMQYLRKVRAPLLNPVIQTTFASYQFRFWHLSPESHGNKYCAFLVISRKDLPAVSLRQRTGHGRSISDMLLSQPPLTALEATICESSPPAACSQRSNAWRLPKVDHDRFALGTAGSNDQLIPWASRVGEERDETREYVGRTTRLKDPVIRCDKGLTIGMVHERVAAWMAEFSDVAAIKLTSV